MKKAKKKPLLVGLIESEHEFVSVKADMQGITMTAYIRSLIQKEMKKK